MNSNITPSNCWTISGRVFPTRKNAVKFLRSLPPMKRYKILSSAPDAQPINASMIGRWYKCYLSHMVDGKVIDKVVIRFSTSGEVLTMIRNAKKEE